MTDDDTQNHLDAWARGETSYRRTWTTTVRVFHAHDTAPATSGEHLMSAGTSPVNEVLASKHLDEDGDLITGYTTQHGPVTLCCDRCDCTAIGVAHLDAVRAWFQERRRSLTRAYLQTGNGGPVTGTSPPLPP